MTEEEHVEAIRQALVSLTAAVRAAEGDHFVVEVTQHTLPILGVGRSDSYISASIATLEMRHYIGLRR